jgi:hypothetical protein
MQLENSKRIYYRDNTEEKRVIEGPESDAERKTGEILYWQQSRYGKRGENVPNKSVEDHDPGK